MYYVMNNLQTAGQPYDKKVIRVSFYYLMYGFDIYQ